MPGIVLYNIVIAVIQSNPIQSNLYCKNTADRTQQNNRQT